MLHPNTRLAWISPEIGYGVFVTAFIPRGTLVWVRDRLDNILTAQEVCGLPAPLRQIVELYGFSDKRGNYVFNWDFYRYVNHSCNPTSRLVGDSLEIAVRDIQPGEQLTCEYATFNQPSLGSTVLAGSSCRCLCGAANCRGEIRIQQDIEEYSDIWDHEAEQAWKHATEVPQPLLATAWVDEADMALLETISGGPYTPPRSVRRLLPPSADAR